jgi:hypothetical protein
MSSSPWEAFTTSGARSIGLSAGDPLVPTGNALRARHRALGYPPRTIIALPKLIPTSLE